MRAGQLIRQISLFESPDLAPVAQVEGTVGDLQKTRSEERRPS